MSLRTPEQYKESLKDGREVYYRGEKVDDVTTHPVIGKAVQHACIDYQMAEDPRYRDLAGCYRPADRTGVLPLLSPASETPKICSSAAV